MSNLIGECVNTTPNDPFNSYLKFPDPIKTKSGKILDKENRPPMSISATAWREFKEQKLNSKDQKKLEMGNKKKEKQKNKTKAMTKKVKVQQKTKLKKTELCLECNDDLLMIHDEECFEFKIIRCPKCKKGYHFNCTPIAAYSYDEAVSLDWMCFKCNNV